MAGNRLEAWDTLRREELDRRVKAELRMDNLSFAEQQLLDAALERLRSWREPIKSGRKVMLDDPPEVNNEEANAASSEQPEPEAKPQKVKRAKAAKPKEKDKVPRGVKKEKAGRGKKKKVAAESNGAKKRAGRAPRISDDAKIMKTDRDNPFKEGSGPYKRVETVLKYSGQTAGTIKRKAGDNIKSSTLSTMLREGLIRVVE